MTERDACRALNSVVIERLIEFDNSRNKRGKNRGKSPVPEIVTSDAVKAQKVLGRKEIVAVPQSTLSFMKRYSITMMPCGLIGLCTSGVINTTAAMFKDEPSSQSTLSVIIDEPSVGTKHSPKVVEPVMEPYSTSIDPQSRDKLPATPKLMSQKRQLTVKKSPGTKKVKTGDELTIKEAQARGKEKERDGNEEESEREEQRVIEIEDESSSEAMSEDESESGSDGESSGSDFSDDELTEAKLELLKQLSKELLRSRKKRRNKKDKKKDKKDKKKGRKCPKKVIS
ncbi:hypothetical protein OCU04_001325 [Sclerotinia nivalis]|uniref:Uncharacterized protein n=1 Tax=Sclerotinia nivalis TaxID=352851 RepID=A0A9X0DPL8_9HELO|nr:hypothetical protein OCU04_001325 [Sclerotinia nivalis]